MRVGTKVRLLAAAVLLSVIPVAAQQLEVAPAPGPVHGSSGVATPVASGALQHTNSLAGPAWRSYAGNWQGVSVNIGSYPAASLFGSGTVPIAEALVGMLNIPSTSTAYNHGAGVSGYARSASTTQAGVGVFGWGMMAADNVQAWGANFGVTNCETPNCIGSGGHSGDTLYGLEVDVNIAPLAAGHGVPTGGARGLYIVGGSTIRPAGGLNGIELDGAGMGMTPHLHWSNAVRSDDGSSDVFASIGALDERTKVASGSQPIVFNARNSAGAVSQSTVTEDQFGNLVLLPANALVVQGPTTVNGTLVVALHTPISSTEACTPGQTADDATYHYWCARANHWLRVAGSAF